MALSDTQVRQLRAKLEARHVKTRKANGTDLHYVEGWHVIAEANRIFGYDASGPADVGKPLRVERSRGRPPRSGLFARVRVQRASRRRHHRARGLR